MTASHIIDGKKFVAIDGSEYKRIAVKQAKEHRFEHYRSEVKMGDAKKTKKMLVNKWKFGGPKEAAIIRVWEVAGRMWYCVYSRRID